MAIPFLYLFPLPICRRRTISGQYPPVCLPSAPLYHKKAFPENILFTKTAGKNFIKIIHKLLTGDIYCYILFIIKLTERMKISV